MACERGVDGIRFKAVTQETIGLTSVMSVKKISLPPAVWGIARRDEKWLNDPTVPAAWEAIGHFRA